jgi:putative ABC transport system substrate-binding protein
MRRREFITILGGVASWPLVARGQQPAMPVIGFMRSTTPAGFEPLIAAFRQGLSQSGFTEGKNVAIEYRWGENRPDRLPVLAADLVRRRVAVVVANGRAAPVAISATKSIPIVFVTGSDPVTTGLVRNLARPSGNVTGVSFFAEPVTAKRLELLAELVPGAKTIALLLDPKNQSAKAELRDLEAAGKALGRKIIVFKATREQQFSSFFLAIRKAGVGALFVGAGAFFSSRLPYVYTVPARSPR